jgi:hypothetical protein
MKFVLLLSFVATAAVLSHSATVNVDTHAAHINTATQVAGQSLHPDLHSSIAVKSIENNQVGTENSRIPPRFALAWQGLDAVIRK